MRRRTPNAKNPGSSEEGSACSLEEVSCCSSGRKWPGYRAIPLSAGSTSHLRRFRLRNQEVYRQRLDRSDELQTRHKSAATLLVTIGNSRR
jgi:hypothetical protein